MNKPAILIDPTNVAEMARRSTREDILREVTGGMWPSEIDQQSVKTVLDMGCGPGQWATTVAFEHPDLSVIGVDSLDEQISYARACAQVQRLANVTFVTMDLHHPPLKFPDGTFDLISARYLSGWLDRDTWPRLFAECMRLLRPGGVLCLTEEEMAISNSSALQDARRSFYHLLADQKRTYSIDGKSLGICHMLKPLMKQAGFREIYRRPFHIDSSASAPLHLACCQNQEIFLALMQSAFQSTSALEQDKYNALFSQIQGDMRDENFVDISFGLQAWGYK